MADFHAFDFLDEPAAATPPFVVLYGDKPFLQQLALEHILQPLIGDDSDGSIHAIEGDATDWRDVNDELATVSLFGPNVRVVVVRAADKFVTKYRDNLEDYANKPFPKSLLVLEVKSWPGNTRLAKQIKKTHLQLDCRAPKKPRGNSLDDKRVIDWIQQRASNQHQRQITKQAADLLFEMVETDFGRIEQELAKLSLFVEPEEKIGPDLVRDMVGGWRTKSTWELADTIASGDIQGALEQLDALLRAGEAPAALLPQLSWSLRRFAVATRIFAQFEASGSRIKLSDALAQAGFRPWPAGAITAAEKQLRRIKRPRALQLYQWLLDADLALKGSHSDPARARYVLEDLCFKLA